MVKFLFVSLILIDFILSSWDRYLNHLLTSFSQLQTIFFSSIRVIYFFTPFRITYKFDQLNNFFYYMMTDISSGIMKYDRYFKCQSKINIEFFLSRTFVFTSHATIISYFNIFYIIQFITMKVFFHFLQSWRVLF